MNDDYVLFKTPEGKIIHTLKNYAIDTVFSKHNRKMIALCGVSSSENSACRYGHSFPGLKTEECPRCKKLREAIK